jgi:DNA repair protein RadC
LSVTFVSQLRMREVHEADRPRERFLRQGPESLSNQELLAILLRTGTKSESVLSLANRILVQFEKLHALKHATVEEMMEIKGVGEAKAIQILAAIELGKRLAQKELDNKYTIRSPEDAANYLIPELAPLQQEHFVALYLNVKNQILHKQTIFVGSLNASIVHPREIFRVAIRRSAAAIIVAHNHPSGNPSPSPEDIDVTKRLIEAGQILGVDLLDHLIIGDHQFISLKEKGYI